MTSNEFNKLRASAARGDKQAMYDLAIAYKNGDGTKKDAEQFFYWMRKAALSDHIVGMSDVAWAYKDGEGTDPDIRLYFEWIKKAAEKGELEAKYNLAFAYKDSEGTEKNDKRFFELIKEAAEKNHPEAMYDLAKAYDEGIGTERDPSKYFEWTKKLADAGEPGAMLRLAEAYKNGKGTAIDEPEFFEWTMNAAKKALNRTKKLRLDKEEEKEQGVAPEDLPIAMYRLALAYKDGKGTSTHKEGKYFMRIKKAAKAAKAAIKEAKEGVLKSESKDILATIMFELALEYKNNRGETEQFFTWMEEAANADLSAAMVELAAAYKDGVRTSSSMRHYRKWIERAANSGDRAGMYHIALAYGTGDGKKHDTGKFLEWINKAVVENHPEAFIARGVAELQDKGLIGKNFMPFFETLFKLHNEVREIQKDHILKEDGENVSGVVAHYTVLNALYSMLPEKPTAKRKANCLRLYNIAYVNDPQEGRRLLSPDKNTGQPLEHSEFLREFFPPTSERKPEHPIPWEGQTFSVYVGSFALAPDRLDLWRAYGNDGLGYSIVTPLSAFNQKSEVGRINLMLNDFQFEVSDDQEQTYTDVQPTLYRVKYKKTEAEKTLGKLAGILRDIKDEKNKIIKAASAQKRRNNLSVKKRVRGLSDDDLRNLKIGKELIDRSGLSDSDLSDLKAGNDLIDSIIRAIVSNILYLYKDDEYQNEMEARMLMGRDITAKDLRIEVDTERVPPHPPHVYVETKAFLFESDKSEIIIGPKVEKKTAAYLNLQKRLAINQFKTQVKLSEIKYR